MFQKFSNPILSSQRFAGAATGGTATARSVVNHTLILLTIVFGSAVFAWVSPGAELSALTGKTTLFAIVAFGIAITACVKKEWSAITAPLYAVFEGLVLGSISRLFEISFPGIVFQAVMLTFGVAFAMLFLYRSGVIKVTERFQMIVGSIMLGILIVYIASFVLSFFGISVPMIHSSGVGGLIFSGIVVTVAALRLVMDFDYIVRVSDCGLPSYMSWFAAFGLMVTLVWLYIEILHLLAKFRRGRS